ncbi:MULTISPECIES: TRAP transporter small permease [Sulfitobacter]|jgi:C4-dicarboxylate transporter DctQ subunit|uniref:TRAP transporter small permease protein n=1 Tax=Sulfitobacter sp. TCYB15 TaxID=3229275 RepID=A0AAU8BZ70_9RHOB|nr:MULTISPECIES: TRAP transporter small permease [Sulfitobacter]EAP84131.1 TRAP transporter, DctQ subunit [Sulfitobacter sp. EE-36]KAJ31619.1 C4-dicarboxylate ABC transporter substrate-binding protein [Sulfitobacter pontiacus 3SOLIMAR09]GLO78137.1 C4-dicarboxylate ABC transporter permease [Sulfitobacter pontiacus]|tara:strand:+ start:276 stop:956 length:681 start_codon:yes stop_codon:yes gene_type:complete
MSHGVQSHSALGRIVNELEETAIAIILGLMTLITFINVVLRYGFNTGIIWGLEAVTFLFAWLVLFGMSYAVKVTAHLGVDAVVNLFSLPKRRVLALVAAAICVVYGALLMKGAWDYWAPFAGLDATTGRWFPTGFADSRDQAWYETVDIPMPDWLRFIEPIMNEGETYGKLPRFIPYFMLPFGMALLLFRFIQAGVRVFTGQATALIVSHEAEDDIEAVKHMNAES